MLSSRGANETLHKYNQFLRYLLAGLTFMGSLLQMNTLDTLLGVQENLTTQCKSWQCCSLAGFLPFTSSVNLQLQLGLGSVLIAGLTCTFRTPAKFTSQ